MKPRMSLLGNVGTSSKRPEIDCPSFGKRLFWPAYGLLNADEFFVFPADIQSNQLNPVQCEIDCEMHSNP
jgi:hypothetical protein